MIRIGDFARLARVSVRALRHYEAKGLLRPSVVDTHSRYRYYDLQQLATLERLLLLKDLGLPLSAIRELLSASEGQFRAALVSHRRRLQSQLLEQEAMLARLGALETWLEGEDGSRGRLIVRTKSFAELRALTLRAIIGADSNAITEMFEATERRARRSRADQSPVLLMHHAPQIAPRRDVEVCVPVTRACRLAEVRDIEPEPHAASITYSGPYFRPEDLYRRVRKWVGQQRLTLARRPIREIYHRFGADQVGYRLPAHRLASGPQRFVTELAIPVQRRQ
jgi:DNA-binding transcriptional MerR regulator